MAWSFWRWLVGRPIPTACASTSAADQESDRAIVHARDIQQARELLERLTDELAVMTPHRDGGER